MRVAMIHTHKKATTNSQCVQWSAMRFALGADSPAESFANYRPIGPSDGGSSRDVGLCAAHRAPRPDEIS